MMNVERIAKKIVQFQESFMEHLFYTAGFMQEQNVRMASALLFKGKIGQTQNADENMHDGSCRI